MTTFNPTAPTFSSPLAPTAFANQVEPFTTVTLDLTTKFGATLHCGIGRAVATALTRSAYIAIRRSLNGSSTRHLPSINYDFISTIAAVTQTTVSSGGAAAETSVVLASGTGFAAEQTVFSCLSATDATRAKWYRISALSTATIYIDRSTGFLVGHTAADIVTNGADFGSLWIPGGDIWEITPINNSGQAVIMAVEAAVYASDTGTA